MPSGAARALIAATDDDAVARHSADCDYRTTFSSLCFNADGREGDEAWQLARSEGTAPLLVFDEEEIQREGLEALEESSVLEDEEDDDWTALWRTRRESLRIALALPELARSGHISVRRTEDREIYDRIFALADCDYAPATLAVSGGLDPAYVAQRVEERQYRHPAPYLGRTIARAPEEWVYWLTYGGGSDEYLAWIHLRDRQRLAHLADAVEAEHRSIAFG